MWMRLLYLSQAAVVLVRVSHGASRPLVVACSPHQGMCVMFNVPWATFGLLWTKFFCCSVRNVGAMKYAPFQKSLDQMKVVSGSFQPTSTATIPSVSPSSSRVNVSPSVSALKYAPWQKSADAMRASMGATQSVQGSVSISSVSVPPRRKLF